MKFKSLRVMVLGGGGREAALALSITMSPWCEQLFVAPGNPGTSALPQTENVPELDIKTAEDIPRVVEFATNNHIGLVIVGPELPLMLGVTDALEKAGIKVFGPSQAAAHLEDSKAFAKELMRTAGVPTASYEVFDDYEQALTYVRRHWEKHHAPIVIKASGLAAGKGVVVARTVEQAEEALHKLMVERVFGEAGDTVVIEDYLKGKEVSVMAVCDGMNHILLPAAQDSKTLKDGGHGPNTGGMGAYAPVPWVTDALLTKFEDRVFRPTLSAMAKAGRHFKGVLYAGLMVIEDDDFMVLEFNVRFGDPETQVILPLLETDLLLLLWACATCQLHELDVKFNQNSAVCVVMTAEGYPGTPKKGDQITGLEGLNSSTAGTLVFHAATRHDDYGRLLTNGGRVLGVVGVDETLEEARVRAYTGVKAIHFKGEHHRTDIGA